MGDTIIKPITIPITGVALNALKVDQTIKAAKAKTVSVMTETIC